MEGAGCCLIVILGLVVWIVFLLLVGALPALGLGVAYLLWSTGQQGAGVLVLMLSLVSALAGVVMYDNGFSEASFLSQTPFPPIVFVLVQAALPTGIMFGLLFLRVRQGYDNREARHSLNAMIVICGLVILIYVGGQSFWDQPLMGLR